MVIVNLVYGLTLPLLSLVLDSQGISKTVIGLSIVAQASAGVLLAPLMPRLILRAGAARTMQHATLLAAGTLIATLIHPHSIGSGVGDEGIEIAVTIKVAEGNIMAARAS